MYYYSTTIGIQGFPKVFESLKMYRYILISPSLLTDNLHPQGTNTAVTTALNTPMMTPNDTPIRKNIPDSLNTRHEVSPLADE